MPFVSANESKEIRKRLKTAFPKPWKFSVTIDHHTSLNVVIKEGTINFKDYESINQYWYKNHLAGETDKIAMLDKLFQTIEGVKERKEESYDSDYGSIPSYYLHVSAGTYSKPYVLHHDGAVVPSASEVNRGN